MSNPAQLKFDQNKFVKKFLIRRKRFLNKVQYHWNTAIEEFMATIISTFYSGRKGGTGLNTITSDLRNSWHKDVSVIAGNVVAKLYSNVDYGQYHEKEYTPKSEPRRFPARTNVAGYFKSPIVGKKLLIDGIKKAIKET